MAKEKDCSLCTDHQIGKKPKSQKLKKEREREIFNNIVLGTIFVGNE
jgi:hypothetical protein